MTQSLDDLEDNRVPERCICRIQLALDHYSLGQFPRGHLTIDLQVTQANVGDLALLEEAMAAHIAGPLVSGISKQSDRCIDMGKVMLRLRDLCLIRRDPPMDLGALVLQRLDDKQSCYALNIWYQSVRSNPNLGAIAA
ncbi:hypothetical protein [Chelatococcus asaccharovorans]|uniref:Uncharacterized protein n=1 Tax=Chelatococcus asaccharovorans TaxID=28210 RepID=A0A2V3UIB4_9HYPH|nr:hypothetical protein [Chelatococcus asaccharovorans]MBS7706260.1 hypothetical protein [Chelatococcus asaccharovorans]PXW65102.1 hypothetical protein C7450_101865 [Chelatococcus asaccharovorans]